MSTDPGPAATYYRGCEGAWAAPMEVSIEDFSNLREGVGFLNALSFWLIAVWPKILGRVWMRTSVTIIADDACVHTTRMVWLGLPLFASREEIRYPDGARLSMTGKARALGIRTSEIRGEGAVDADGSAARYTITMMGMTLDQRAEFRQNVVTLEQRLPGMRARQPLQRQ